MVTLLEQENRSTLSDGDVAMDDLMTKREIGIPDRPSQPSTQRRRPTSSHPVFDLANLSRARQKAGKTLKQVAFETGLSAAQVQRIEAGVSQLTLDFLDKYCRSVGCHPLDVLEGEVRVPLVGVVGSDSVVRPLGPTDPTTVRAPRLVSNIGSLQAVLFGGDTKFKLMNGHVAFFSAAHTGVPDSVWNARSIIRLEGGNTWIGWPLKRHGQIHIADFERVVEFNAALKWAAPLLGVMSPDLIDCEGKS